MKEHTDPSRDRPKVREFTIEQGVVTATQTDPYGHMHLSSLDFQLPERFQGKYTTWKNVELDIAQLERALKEIDAQAISGNSRK